MSYHAEETYDVYDETPRTARKAHACDACKETVAPGHTYYRIFWRYDGSAKSIKRCLKCQRIHEHLRALGADDEMWPSETLSCGEEYEKHWGVKPPPEIAAIAFMTQGEAQTALRASQGAP